MDALHPLCPGKVNDLLNSNRVKRRNIGNLSIGVLFISLDNDRCVKGKVNGRCRRV
jgi:hypothetical protein